ncbi:Protein HAPLESS 2, partial [Cucurbita argyrosperma subsp. sororia]
MGNCNLLALCLLNFLATQDVAGVQILSKSKLEKCERNSASDSLNCTKKIVLNMAVPSGSSGGEASIIAEIVEVEENSTNKMQTLRTPPVLTVSKSAAYVLYDLTYIRDVPYKPQEFYVRTRKCEPDATARVVHICERLRDESGHIIQSTQPICCPCGAKRRMPTSCGNFFDKMIKGKANTAHCLRFPGDWFHVFSIGQWSLGFSLQIHVKSGSKASEVSVGPENRTVVSNDSFLRVNLIGDLVGYTNIPSFEDFYLVIPRQGGPGQPQNMGHNFSMWMLLERVRFTLDGLECNKIGVGYETFNSQPDFCTSPFWSCLHNQLWNFREVSIYNRQGIINITNIDMIRCIFSNLTGRSKSNWSKSVAIIWSGRKNAGTHSFSIGITEVLNTNLVIELRADDVEYVYQRSPGKIMSINIPTFEALTQFGVATVTTKNTGELEASYSLTFTCSKEVSLMEEQYFLMKPKEVASRSFKLYPTTDQAAKYVCSVQPYLRMLILVKLTELSVNLLLLLLFLTMDHRLPLLNSPTKRKMVSSIQSSSLGRGYGETSSTLSPENLAVVVVIWILHEKGLFDPVYEWWEGMFGAKRHPTRPTWMHRGERKHTQSHRHGSRHYQNHGSGYHKRRSHESHKKHKHSDRDTHYFLHHVHRTRDKGGHNRV